MTSNNVQEKTVRFFGDESHTQEIVTYGFILVPTRAIACLEASLAEVKCRYNLPVDARIHCRTMFNAHARAKTDFKSFTLEQIHGFLHELMAEAFVAGARGWVGYLVIQDAPVKLLFESENGSLGDEWDVQSLKNRMCFCYQAAMAPLTHMFPPSSIEAFVDGDKTKIPFLQQNKQVNSLRSFFPVEHGGLKFTPCTVDNSKPLPLDLADVLAYAAARGLSKWNSPEKTAFVSMVKAIDPGYSQVLFETPPTSGAVFKIRPYDPGDRVKSYFKRVL